MLRYPDGQTMHLTCTDMLGIQQLTLASQLELTLAPLPNSMRPSMPGTRSTNLCTGVPLRGEGLEAIADEE